MKTIKVWARVGMSAELTEKEIFVLNKENKEAKELLKQLISSGKFVLDGETYFPDNDDVNPRSVTNLSFNL